MSYNHPSSSRGCGIKTVWPCVVLARFDLSRHVVAAKSPAALAKAFAHVCNLEASDYEQRNPLRRVAVFTSSGKVFDLKNTMWTLDAGYQVPSVQAVNAIRELKI